MIASRTWLHNLLLLVAVVLCACGAHVLSLYLQYEPVALVRTVVFSLLLVSLWYRFRSSFTLTVAERGAHAVFSLLLSAVIVLGYHIVIDFPKSYEGTINDNYISDYSAFDVVALFGMAAVLYVLLTSLFCKLKSHATAQGAILMSRGYLFETQSGSIPARSVLAHAALILLLWIPYLLTYWPGLVFGDTLTSLSQAVGGAALSNHHPVVYTLFIKACIRCAQLTGLDITWGLGLYSICQMSFMAICFGYMASWLTVRSGRSARFGWLLAVCAGISLNLGGYSVAMWKDPMFSSALMMLAPMLFDLACLNRNCITARWIALFAFVSMVSVFLRSNGLYVVALLTVVLIALSIFRRLRGGAGAGRHAAQNVAKKKPGFAVPIIVLVIVLAAHSMVTGPIYGAMGVYPTPKVESVGVPLNQMARVAALDGAMSDADREFMDSMLSLELYPTTYSPTCTDKLKWSGDFHGEQVGSGEFWSHWISMLIRNPRIYFEAWELQTCGFWTVNVPAVVSYDENIGGGMPRNFGDELQTGWGINAQNLFGTRAAYKLFPYNVWSVPVGIILWTLLYLAMVFVLMGRKRLLLPLIPSLGLLGTLLIASPIWYWARYGAAVQFLLPFYAFLVLLATGCFKSGGKKARIGRSE